MNITLTADWLYVFGGAEHVIAEFHELWPSAPIFTTITNRMKLGPLADADIRTSSLQKWYRLLRRHEPLLPLMPRAMENMNLKEYDVILSSSHAIGKGIVPPSHALHVCYCHTPMRYAWEMEHQYLRDFRVPKILRKRAQRALMNLRRWDLTSAKRTDLFIANSRTVQDRIRTIYARDSIVIPPPVQEHFFRETLIHSNRSEAPLLAVGRLVPYKRFDLLIELANTLNLPLIIVGKGREELRLKRMAGPTVTFLEHIKDNDLSRLYAQARALLFPQHEDAGIVPLEAQACGTPVIAFQKGGAMEVVRDRETGIFFREQSLASLTDALDRFNRETFDPQTIRNHAQQFSASRFRERIREAIEEAYGKRVAS